ncbi:Mediator of RNA polymerase II transcription subunit 21 [Exophiala oligosperma]
MSTDILTQLQTTYDQLLTQFFSTVSYLSQRHPLVAPEPDPSDPYTNPPAVHAQAVQTPTATNPDGGSAQNGGLLPGPEDTDRSVYPLRPASAGTFESAQRELAEDLVAKAQQIEFLISRLPGIGRGEDEQAREIRELVERVRAMEVRRKTRRKEMRETLRKLDGVVLGMAQSVDYEEEEEEEVSNAGHDGANGTVAGV